MFQNNWNTLFQNVVQTPIRLCYHTLMKQLIHLLLFIASTHSAAQSQLKYGNPFYAGTACPPHSAAVLLSPDAAFFEMNFSDFSSEPAHPFLSDSKSCQITIPFFVPRGLRIDLRSLTQFHLNLQIALDKETSGQVTIENSVDGKTFEKKSQNLRGPLSQQDYKMPTSIIATPEWSGCGRTLFLRTRITLKTSKAIANSFAILMIDQIKSAERVRYSNCVFQINSR